MNINFGTILSDWMQEKNIIKWLDVLNKSRRDINNEVMRLIKIPLGSSTNSDIKSAYDILVMSNIIYNNSVGVTIIEDAIYDRLIEWYKMNTGKNVIGAVPIYFPDNVKEKIKYSFVKGMEYLTNDEDISFMDKNLFFDELYRAAPFNPNVSLYPGMTYEKTVSKRLRNTSHANPSLVGTLDKCKFCLVKQAENADPELLKDPTVKIVERDFFGEHIQEGIINPDGNIDICCELKYDGVSVEATILNGMIIRAGTRGDTDADLSADLTPILYGYRFPRCINLNKEINVKFEAIMTYYNLNRYSELKGKEFVNGRTAIISWIGSSDAYNYRELVTLIPLATDLTNEDGSPIDRLVEIEFMNKYLTRTELLRYSVISGNLVSVLYQIYKYSEEAQYMRKLIPFMYDGIVISYLDPVIRATLGRKDFVNKYTIALKFDPLVKRTRFDHYTFEIGQNGVITPRIWFDPVEFFGSIHPKSSGHSYGRFKALSLKPDDFIDVTYRNDVMTYVTKADCVENDNNSNPVVEFPRNCPECGTPLIFTDSSAMCPNINCKGRTKKRMANMFAKLQFSGFAEETVESLDISSFKDLMELRLEDITYLGDLTSKSLINQINDLKSPERKIPDWFIVGALGFSNLAGAVWKKIFSTMTLKQFVFAMDAYYTGDNSIVYILDKVPGIGDKIIEVIIKEYPLFEQDIKYALENINIIDTLNTSSVKIRFTGFRDKDLVDKLTKLGADAGEGSVTKDTAYLVVPYDGYKAGSKYAKAVKYGVRIISRQELENNIEEYI